ncbi:uncharacterized protein B0T15DRAFT_388745 [Chaetomium strumarium]|uniref:Uncharacterized protein n=1 Tax=Chaetomium strumarium TaxID=1170767 RepID=A0AAJ0M753_9PEZI|nr:hypothetical protein B0T15DRAFT_388745 [Chaetomium strumarium]
MDIRDDPSTTTTTTDYDSGDSEDVKYVYEGHGRAERKDTKGRCAGRNRSPRTRARAARCTCGAGLVDDNAEITVLEEETDVEHEEHVHKHSRRPRQPSGSSGVSGCHRCHDKKVKDKADKKKSTEKKARGTWVPYIEEYPDESPRPAILLKEHKIPRRASTSDAKHLRDSSGNSLSAGSRGRSPTGKRLPPRPPRRPSKDSPKHSEHIRRLDLRETHADEFSDHDARSFSSDSDEPSLASTRRSHHVSGRELTSTVSRSSAWHGSQQPKYSSSWPLNVGSRMPQRRPTRPHDADEESEEHEDFSEDHSSFNEQQHARRYNRPASFHERDRDRETRHRVSPPPQREHARSPPRQQPRRRQAATDAGSIAAMDQDRRSVAASTVYEVWRGHASDWESPYVSAVDDDNDNDYDSEIEESVRLLSLNDLPPRTPSPHLLPPRGERRGNFGFQSDSRSPPPRYHHHHHHHHLSVYNRGLPAGPSAIRGISYNLTWDGDDDGGLTGSSNQPLLLLLDGPRVLTTEQPDAITDEEDSNNNNTRQSRSLSSRWSKRHAGRTFTFTQPRLALPRSPRAVSSVFSAARETREGFLSPRPTRFDFGAWEV